jgi:putative phosphoesterase
MLVGLISDTHSLIRPEALAALAGVELILHAGDVGTVAVLRALQGIAPVHAVFGNTDNPSLGLPQQVDLTLERVSIHMSHGHEVGSPTPEKLAGRYAADVIVYGHTHKPLVTRRGKTLVVNPGAAGARRFNLQPSVGLLRLENGVAHADIVQLQV